MAYTHGIATTASGMSGYVQSISFDRSAKEATVEDAYGETVLVEKFDETVTCKAELKFETSTTDLEIGDVITISGAQFTKHNGAYMIETISESYQNKDFAGYSVEMKRYLAHGIPATASV